MSKFIEIDVTELRSFFRKMGEAADGRFQEEFARFQESFGNEFLNTVQDEIVRRNVIDTGLLLASFQQGGEGSVWIMSEGGMTLEVGTDVKYADWVEHGHSQQPGRFIPGHWSGAGAGAKFVYEPGAGEGMVLKASFVNGKHFFEGAFHIMEKIAPQMWDEFLQKWLDNCFG